MKPRTRDAVPSEAQTSASGADAERLASASWAVRLEGMLRSPWAVLVVVGTLMCVAALLAIHAIGDKSLWLDEGLSARLAQFSPADAISATYSTPTPGAIALYYVLLHFWSSVSTDESWLRLLSAVCVVASIPLVYMLGRRLMSTAAGVTAATVVALSPYVVSQAQSARPYGLVILLATALTLTFYSAMKVGGLRIWLLYAAVALAGVYAHTTVAYLIAAQGAVAGVDLLLLRRRSIWTIGSRCAAAAVIVVGCYPLTGQFSAEGLAGVPSPTFQNVGQALYHLTGGATLLLVTSFAVIALPLIGWVWLRRGRQLEFSILVAVSVAPIALELLVSLQRPMFIERYLTMAIPGLALLVAAAVDLLSSWKPSLRGAVATRSPRQSAIVTAGAWALIAVLALRSVGSVYTGWQEQWRGAVEMVAAESQSGDQVIVYPGYARLPFDYYATRNPGFRNIRPAFPEIGWGDYFPASGPSFAASLADAKQTGRVWLVYRSGDGVGATDASLIASFVSCGITRSDTTLEQVEVVLVEFPAAGCLAAR